MVRLVQNQAIKREAAQTGQKRYLFLTKSKDFSPDDILLQLVDDKGHYTESSYFNSVDKSQQNFRIQGQFGTVIKTCLLSKYVLTTCYFDYMHIHTPVLFLI